MQARGASEAIKMKSLTTDEIGLDEALAREGIAAWETDLAEMSRAVGGVSIRMPTLAAMAFAADRYWEPRLDFLQSRSPQSFGGLYTFLFRNYSGLVHASFRGLNRVTVDVPDDRKRVVVQAPLETNAPCGVATVVYGIGLYVAAQALGWPAADEVSAVFERFPVAVS